jgi:hypothetical protein
LTAALAGLVLLAGCGTLDMQLQTDVKASGNYTQSVVITATGALAENFDAVEDVNAMTEEGWEVSTTRSGDAVTLSAVKDFTPEDAFFLPDSTGTESPVLDIERQNYFVFSDYVFTVNIPADPEAMGLEDMGDLGDLDGLGELDDLGQYDQLMLNLMKDMFTMSWTVNMPGEIKTANADAVAGSSATWNFDITTLSQGGVMTAEVRVINWAFIGGLAAFIVILAALGFIFSRRHGQ